MEVKLYIIKDNAMYDDVSKPLRITLNSYSYLQAFFTPTVYQKKRGENSGKKIGFVFVQKKWGYFLLTFILCSRRSR
jgi:hypothetical protein